VLISLCIPCHNRTYDLKQTLPLTIEAARHSLYTETVVLDYASPDDLDEYIHAVRTSLFGRFNDPPLVYRKYTGRDYYHMAHARNLSVLASHGDYALISSADIIITPAYLDAIRAQIANGCVWVHPSDTFVGCVCIHRDEFEAAGGFDERFSLYGKEDKDLHARLVRRGAKHAAIPDVDLELIYTPWEKKLENYPGGSGRYAMHKRSKRLFAENCEKGVLVANEGQEWGSWE